VAGCVSLFDRDGASSPSFFDPPSPPCISCLFDQRKDSPLYFSLLIFLMLYFLVPRIRLLLWRIWQSLFTLSPWGFPPLLFPLHYSVMSLRSRVSPAPVDQAPFILVESPAYRLESEAEIFAPVFFVFLPFPPSLTFFFSPPPSAPVQGTQDFLRSHLNVEESLIIFYVTLFLGHCQ